MLNPAGSIALVPRTLPTSEAPAYIIRRRSSDQSAASEFFNLIASGKLHLSLAVEDSASNGYVRDHSPDHYSPSPRPHRGSLTPSFPSFSSPRRNRRAAPTFAPIRHRPLLPHTLIHLISIPSPTPRSTPPAAPPRKSSPGGWPLIRYGSSDRATRWSNHGGSSPPPSFLRPTYKTSQNWPQQNLDYFLIVMARKNRPSFEPRAKQWGEPPRILLEAPQHPPSLKSSQPTMRVRNNLRTPPPPTAASTTAPLSRHPPHHLTPTPTNHRPQRPPNPAALLIPQ